MWKTVSKKVGTPIYFVVHVWLRTKYGSASKCEGRDCNGKSKKFEWAKVKDKEYEKKRENFLQLCHSCHVKYDHSEESYRKMREKNWLTKRTHCEHGHLLSGDNLKVYTDKRENQKVRLCKECHRIALRKWKQKLTPEQYAEFRKRENENRRKSRALKRQSIKSLTEKGDE